MLVELVLRADQDGESPEEIVEAYSTTTLSDVYSVISYYLRHREEMDEYLNERERIAADVRQKIECIMGDLAELRQRLRSQRNR